MKKIIYVLTLIFSVHRSIFYGQNLTNYTKYYSDTAVADMQDLSWIRTENDFNQENLTEEEIEHKISNLISKNSDVYSIECPINSKKIKYLGHIFSKRLIGIFK